jgi:16S rRNA processing protein RimM
MPTLVVATVRKPHGVRGALKILAHTDDPEAFLRYKAFAIGGKAYAVETLVRQADGFILKLAGVDTCEGASALRGKELCVDRSLIDTKSPLVSDYIGLQVFLPGGEAPVARVTGYVDGGVGGLFEIARDDGVTFLVPVTRELWGLPDLEKGRVILDDPESHFLS